MTLIEAAVLLGGFTLIFVAIAVWRVSTGTFCDLCKRPAHKCSCVEDGFANEEFSARRK